MGVKLMSSTILSPWLSNSLYPQITIDFDEKVTFLDVVLKSALPARPEYNTFDKMTKEEQKVHVEDMKASFKNIKIIIGRNEKEVEVASTTSFFDAGTEVLD